MRLRWPVGAMFLAAACGDPSAAPAPSDASVGDATPGTDALPDSGDDVPTEPSVDTGTDASAPPDLIPITESPCRVSDDCRDFGRCTLEGGECIATSDADCRASDFCATFGDCVASGYGFCEPGSDADCAASEYCGIAGWCDNYNGACFASTDAHCKESEHCVDWGDCTFQDGQCIAKTDEDCEASDGCDKWGWCSVVFGKCVVASHADCAGSYVCKEFGECKARDGSCVEGSGSCHACPVAKIIVAEGLLVASGTALHLDGSGSTSSCGVVDDWEWAVDGPAGSAATLSPGGPSPTQTFLPDLPGTYTFALGVTDTTDMVSCVTAEVAVTVAIPDGVDLFAAGLTCLPSAVEAGGTVVVEVNVGAPAAGAITAGWFFAVELVPTTGDPVLLCLDPSDPACAGVAPDPACCIGGALEGGGSATESRFLTAPDTLEPGDYTCVVRLDSPDDIGENDESNNTRSSPKPITILAP
ncbi:MAG: PKD domain-containing protein [Myxococcales bacterium]|nr:PKD domain-containing protein [Myxococcales bacterium]